MGSSVVKEPHISEPGGSSDPDGNFITYGWDFSDGGMATGFTPTYTYSAQGIFTETLTVTDEFGGIAITTTPADISPVPIPATVWLFGSGLPGLVGIAKRKNAD